MVVYSSYESDNRVLRYAESLALRGGHVDVISLRKEGQSPRGELNGVQVFRIQKREYDEKRKSDYFFKILLFWFRSMFLLSMKHLRRRYDVIHVHSVPDFLVFTAWLPKITGSGIILDIHDLVPEFYASKFNKPANSLVVRALRLVERLSIAFSDHVIIANHLWRDTLLSRSVKSAKCSVVLNLPDRSLFCDCVKTRKDGKFVVLFPGTLNWHQGLDIAIRAFSLMKDQAPGAELHIYGEGSAKPSLLALVQELGLQERVLLRDGVPIAEVAQLMANADMGVVPKRSDSFGNEAFSTKILEFMALRVPVVVADTKIDRYYFNDSLVKFFHSGDPEDLAHSILLLMRDANLRESLAQNGAAFVEKNNWDAKKEEYLQLVDSLVGVRGSQ
jgi:glycosyltransferase involved in cell wall biosynthesis